MRSSSRSPSREEQDRFTEYENESLIFPQRKEAGRLIAVSGGIRASVMRVGAPMRTGSAVHVLPAAFQDRMPSVMLAQE